MKSHGCPTKKPCKIMRKLLETTMAWKRWTELRGKCFSTYFWFPPACRIETSKCLLFLTSFGYEIWMMMQRAAICNMPVVPANVKHRNRYIIVPTQISCLFYAWEPDPTFLGLGAKMIVYPRYNRSAWEQGVASTAIEGVRLETW